jgi:hypothetical protein
VHLPVPRLDLMKASLAPVPKPARVGATAAMVSATEVT